MNKVKITKEDNKHLDALAKAVVKGLNKKTI